MLTPNLSTRPFYNERAVRVALGLAAVLLAALSGLHLTWALSLRSREAVLSARATEAREQASRLRAEAGQMRAQVDPRELEVVSAAAREANAAIELRAFSWRSLLVQLEQTLPDDVRVTSIRPRLEERDIVHTLSVEAKSDEALSTFMDGLEGTGAFRDVLPAQRQWADDDIIDAVIEGVYVPEAAASVARVEPDSRDTESRP
jgi:hypothetical protein